MLPNPNSAFPFSSHKNTSISSLETLRWRAIKLQQNNEILLPARIKFRSTDLMLHPGTSAYFDLLDSAYTGNLDRFKIIASRYDNRGDGLAITIERLKDRLGRGSLIFAAAGGSVNVCRYLLEELNLDIDVKDNHGGTPLCYGAVKGHLNSVEYLLEKSVNPNGSNNLNSTFNAPLHYVVLGVFSRFLQD
ncbi:hypothetical protein MKW98_007766 [Papaver atlanticum]|uniref:Uncharacterized protein n=1 Tax=Papaver atlanticum TaxID=357466 RepID=A0AAD4RXQ1_9MAGN|nr:hypothetical protein MKW98_007766 [Papaver atlanticum]